MSDRGRRRQRSRTVDLVELRSRLGEPSRLDTGAWQQIRSLLMEMVGESTFEVWLAALELIAVDPAGQLIIGCSAATRIWVARRYGRVLAAAAERAGAQLRLAEEIEQQALALSHPTTSPDGPTAARARHPHRHQEAS